MTQERTPHSSCRDLRGHAFGKLTAVAYVGSDHRHYALWRCVCACGGEKVVPSHNLTSKRTQSCGCIPKGRRLNSKPYDLVGMRFGRLVVVERGPSMRHGTRHKVRSWRCRCDCGNEKFVKSTLLTKGATKSCGCIRVGKRARGVHGAAMNDVLRHYHERAHRRGHEWALSDDAAVALFRAACTYCGAPPYQLSRRRGTATAEHYSGIDRIDSSRGYVDGNVTPCCGRCNIAKGAMSLPDFRAWVALVYDRFFGDSDLSDRRAA